MAKSTVAVAALLTATAAGAGGYYYLQNKDPGDRPEQLAQAVPEQAYAVGYIATDAKTWSKLDRFGNPAARQLIDRSIQQMQKDLVGDMNYQKDVQPWLGNIMLASFSINDQAADKASNRSTLLAVSKVKNKLSAFNFLNKLKSKSPTAATETEYKGAKIWSVSGKDPYHVASLDDWLVGSSDRAAVEKSIDTIKGASSFMQKNGNQFFASGKLNLPNSIASVYLDFPRMAKAVAGSNKLNASQVAEFSQVQSFVAGTGIDDQGIRMKSLTQVAVNSLKVPAKTGKVLANFPEDSLLVLNGTGLKGIWNEAVKQFDSEPRAKAALADVRKAFYAQTKLDLDKDLFGWLDGEYAVGIFPQKSGFLGSLIGTGITAVVESTNKQSNQKSLDNVIKSLVAGNAPITPAQSKSGKTINNIISPLGGGMMMNYGELDDRSVFLSSREMTISEPLTKGAEFQKIVGSLPQSDQGLVYLNFQRVAALLESEPLKEQSAGIPADYLSLLKSIEGLAIGNKIAGDTYETEGILTLKPAK